MRAGLHIADIHCAHLRHTHAGTVEQLKQHLIPLGQGIVFFINLREKFFHVHFLDHLGQGLVLFRRVDRLKRIHLDSVDLDQISVKPLNAGNFSRKGIFR